MTANDMRTWHEQAACAGTTTDVWFPKVVADQHCNATHVAEITGVALKDVQEILTVKVNGNRKIPSRIKQDTVMGVVFSGMFGLGIVMYTQVQTDVHLDHILFGDMLGIGINDIFESGLIALVASAAIILKWRDLVLHAFDPAQAKAAGLPVRVLHYGLLVVLSATIVGALKAVGLILAIAMLIAPGAIAFLITRRFAMMMIVSVVVAVSSSLLGVYASFFINSAPAPTIVLLMTIIFIAAFIWRIRRTAMAERKVTP